MAGCNDAAVGFGQAAEACGCGGGSGGVTIPEPLQVTQPAVEWVDAVKGLIVGPAVIPAPPGMVSWSVEVQAGEPVTAFGTPDGDVVLPAETRWAAEIPGSGGQSDTLTTWTSLGIPEGASALVHLMTAA